MAWYCQMIGIRSGMGYCGSLTLKNYMITPNLLEMPVGLKESHPHDVQHEWGTKLFHEQWKNSCENRSSS